MTAQPAVEESLDLAQHRDALLGFIWRVVGARDLAEDLTQETVITSYSIHYTKLYETGSAPRAKASPG